MTPAVPAVQYLRLCTCLPSPLHAFVVVLLHVNICVRANALVCVHARARAGTCASRRRKPSLRPKRERLLRLRSPPQGTRTETIAEKDSNVFESSSYLKMRIVRPVPEVERELRGHEFPVIGCVRSCAGAGATSLAPR